MNAQGVAGRGVPDAEPRRQHRRPVPDRRHAVGPAAHAADRGVRRAEESDAAPGRRVPHRHAVVDRPARTERLRRRVPDPARRVPRGSEDRGVRHDRRDPVGDLHAVDVPAGELRHGDQREERGAEGSQPARVGGARADHRDDRADGRAAEPVPAADRAVGRSDAEPDPSGGAGPDPGGDAGGFGTRPFGVRSSPLESRRIPPNPKPGSRIAPWWPDDAVTARNRADGVRGGRRHRRHDRRSVPRTRASGCRSAASAWSAWSAPRSRRSCCGTTTRSASASSWPTTSACSSRWCSSSSACCRWRSRRRRSSARGCPQGEYYALMLFSLAGMMLMATATDLLVIFLALEVMSHWRVHAHGDPARLAAQHRSGVQVFPARRVLERVLPLRHRVHLRPHRQHAARSRRQPHRGAGDDADADAAAGARPAARRLRVQGVGRAVPHVDAGRIRRRATGGHRLHVHRRQGRCVRRVRARVPLRIRAAARRLGTRALGRSPPRR